MHRLRQKLDDRPGTLIRTMPGVGYSLCTDACGGVMGPSVAGQPANGLAVPIGVAGSGPHGSAPGSGGLSTVARGKLRLYLGAAPGVGKTYAMLNEGWRRKERGTDVIDRMGPGARPAPDRRPDPRS